MKPPRTGTTPPSTSGSDRARAPRVPCRPSRGRARPKPSSVTRTARASTARAGRPGVLEGRGHDLAGEALAHRRRWRRASAASAPPGSGRPCRGRLSSPATASTWARRRLRTSPAGTSSRDHVLVPGHAVPDAPARSARVAVRGRSRAPRISRSVTPPRAETTTRGRAARRSRTRSATRRGSARRNPPRSRRTSSRSRQQAARLEELGVQDGGPGRAADRVVDERLELQVEEAVLADAAHARRPCRPRGRGRAAAAGGPAR